MIATTGTMMIPAITAPKSSPRSIFIIFYTFYLKLLIERSLTRFIIKIKDKILLHSLPETPPLPVTRHARFLFTFIEEC